MNPTSRLKKTAATIVLPLIVLLFVQVIATAQTKEAFKFLDEDSQEGATLGALSTPRPWLTTVASDWMSKLPDNLKVADLSIPGTHDSGTFKISIASGARTQNWTIRGQLDAGMRFLDLRAHPSGDTFKVYHGSFYMDVTFDEVMSDIEAFLAAHPKEGIIIQLQEEGKDTGAADFQTIWNSYISRYGISVLRPTNDAITLKDLRGKILLRSQIETNMVMQNYWDVWFLDDNNSDYNSHRASLRAKLNLIEKYMKDARADVTGTWYFNSLSGATHMTPVDVARATNQKAYDLIGVSTGTKRKLGLIQMDFPAERLVYRIIKSNFTGGSPSARSITFNNQAGYVAQMTVIYFMTETIGGVPLPIGKSLSTPAISVGFSSPLEIPRDTAKGMPISVVIEGIGTVKGKVLETTVPEAFNGNVCFKSWGTIFDAKGGPCQ